MESLDKEIRLDIEKQIDYIYEEPEVWEPMFHRFLIKQGIEPNLETVLSIIAGMCIGMAYEQIKSLIDHGHLRRRLPLTPYWHADLSNLDIDFYQLVLKNKIRPLAFPTL